MLLAKSQLENPDFQILEKMTTQMVKRNGFHINNLGLVPAGGIPENGIHMSVIHLARLLIPLFLGNRKVGEGFLYELKGGLFLVQPEGP